MQNRVGDGKISAEVSFSAAAENRRLTSLVGNTRYVLVIEVKRDSLGKGLVQLLLALKSMWEVNNDQKPVYGFVTTGIEWQLVTYDGQTWKLSERSTVLLPNMAKEDDRWLKKNSQILYVIHSILSSI
jgi:hypothetical protein